MKRLAQILWLSAAGLAPLGAQDAPDPDAPGQPKDVGWPREYKTDTHTVVVFQPQIDERKFCSGALPVPQQQLDLPIRLAKRVRLHRDRCPHSRLPGREGNYAVVRDPVLARLPR